MKIIDFEVQNREIKQINYEKMAGYQNVDTFRFKFDEEWEGLDKTLVLIVDEERYHVALLNDEAVLPKEIYEAGNIIFGVFGKKDNTILSTVLTTFHIYKGAYGEGQEPSNLPSKTQWDLYVAELNNLLKSCQLSESECNKALEDLIKLRDETLSEMNDIKNETQNFRDETSNLKDDTQAIADDVKDMASAMTFTTFEVDPKTRRIICKQCRKFRQHGIFC